MILHLLLKDIKLELRTKAGITLILLFSLTSSFLLSATIPQQDAFAPLLLLIFLLAGILGYSSSFLREFDFETIEGLKASPLTPQQVVLGKMLFNVLLVLLVQVFVFPVCYALFDVSGNFILAFLSFALCNSSIAITITALSPLLSHSRSREMLLTVLLFPVIFPLLTKTVSSVNSALAGNIDVSGLIFVVAYSAMILSLSLLTADKVM